MYVGLAHTTLQIRRSDHKSKATRTYLGRGNEVQDVARRSVLSLMRVGRVHVFK